MGKRTFLMGGKDLEMQTIKEILDQNGEKVLDKGLGRGAKIDAYKEDLKEIVDQDLYACELEGAGEGDYSNVKSLDHHGERAHEKATLLQVLDVLGLEANLEHKLIAANDSGYIPAMREHLSSEGITDEGEIQKMVSLIRFKDRQAQGITQEQENQAQEAISSKEELLKGKLTVVKLPHSKCATVTDRLFGKYQNLLVLSGDGEVNFYGDGKMCEDLKAKFEGWNGGSGLGIKGGNAYRGGYPKHDEVQDFVIESLKEGKKAFALENDEYYRANPRNTVTEFTDETGYPSIEELQEERVLYHLDLVGDTLKLKFGEAASNDEIVAYVEKQLKQKIEAKEIGGGEIIKLDGPASLPVAVVLAHKLAHLYGTIAVWDPKLGKFVVAVSHSGNFKVGDMIQ